MRPAIGQDDPGMILGEGFVGAVPITDEHRLHQVGVELAKWALDSGPRLAAMWKKTTDADRVTHRYQRCPALPVIASKTSHRVSSPWIFRFLSGQALSEVTDRGMMGFYARLQGRFPLHQLLVPRPQ